MKNLDCIQIEIFINLEIIEEEDKKKKITYIFKNLTNFYNLVKSRGTTTTSKLNFYYIVYDMIYIHTDEAKNVHQ